MNTTLTAICRIPGTGRVMTPRRVNARLAPGGREGSRERDTRVARTPPASDAARWQLILGGRPSKPESGNGLMPPRILLGYFIAWCLLVAVR